MKILKWLDENIESTLSFLFYLYLTLIIFFEVLRRYLFHTSSTWGEETAIYAFIWMTYIAVAKGVKERTHLTIDIVYRLLGRKGKLAILVLSDICFLIVAVTIFYYSLIPIQTSLEYGQMMLGTNVPMWLATVAVPFGWALVIFRVIQRFFKTIKNYRDGQPLTHESNVSI